MRKILILFFFLTTPYFLLSTPVAAQQITLSFSPPLVETVIKPGKSILIAYTLKNIGDPVIVKIKVLPFTARNNLGNVNIKPEFEGPVRFSLDNSEIEMEQPFFLKSGDSQQLLLRMRIPEGAPEGDYYYTFLAETQPPPSLEGTTASSAKATIGANILITVTQSGNLDIKGRIATFDVLPHWKLEIGNWKLRLFDSNDKIPVVLTVDNQGKNVIKPQGEIVLTGNFGEKASFEIIPQNVLAQSQRLMTATPSASINSKSPVSLVVDGFFIGRYSLLATVLTGNNLQNITATTSFIALPFKILLGILAAIFIGIIIGKKLGG